MLPRELVARLARNGESCSGAEALPFEFFDGFCGMLSWTWIDVELSMSLFYANGKSMPLRLYRGRNESIAEGLRLVEVEVEEIVERCLLVYMDIFCTSPSLASP